MHTFKICLRVLPLLFMVSACDSRVAKPQPDLTLIHVNDTYRIDAVEDGSRGGFARVATVVRQLKAGGRDVRISHGGDFLYPSLESQLWSGEQMIEAMNFLHDLAPMFVVPGNHEFDPRKPDSLITAVRQSRFPWLADNVDYRTGDAEVDAAFRRGFTFTAGGRTIGVFSLTILMTEDEGGGSRDYATIDNDYVGNADKQISALEAKGVDVVIGLTHLLLEDDRKVAQLKTTHPKF
jgi:5'-nucleotidase